MEGQRGDELNFADCIIFVSRNRKIILWTVAASVVAGAIMSYSIPKRFASEAVVVIAFTGRKEYVFSKEEAKQTILSNSILQQVVKENPNIFEAPTADKLRKMITVEPVKDPDTPAIKISVKNREPKVAQAICASVLKEFIKFGSPRYAQQIAVTRGSLKAVEIQIESAKENIAKTAKRISELSSDEAKVDPEKMSKVLLLDGIMDQRNDMIVQLLKEEDVLRTRLAAGSDFIVLNLPEIPTVASGSGRTQIMVIFLVTGIIGGISVAFIADAIKSAREQ